MYFCFLMTTVELGQTATQSSHWDEEWIAHKPKMFPVFFKKLINQWLRVSALQSDQTGFGFLLNVFLKFSKPLFCDI